MAGPMITTQPPVKRIQQPNTSSCWFAACQMLFQWKGKPVDDVKRLLVEAEKSDSRVDFDYWYESGIGHSDTVPLAKGLGLKWGAGGELSLSQIQDAVKNWGPLLAVGAWNTHSHVIVVWGAEQVADAKYESVAKLWVANPWFGSPDKEERNMYWFNGGLGHWKGINGQYMHW
jgi:hypothetical protein